METRSGESLIDVVLPWVDGSDKLWQLDYQKHSNGKKIDIERFRDWDNLKYVFRSIEKNMPWVRKVYFITAGHIPDFLNLNCSKLVHVKHADFIPEEYLPTFNSHTIELNFHRIPDLSENFIYFNDDTFALNRIEREYFFKKNLPVDYMIMNPIYGGGIEHHLLRNICVINRRFNNKYHFKTLKNLFRFDYGTDFIRNLALMPWKKYTGFYDPHSPLPYKKKTFKDVWDLEHSTLNGSCITKHRELSDVNQYLFRYWRLCSGEFFNKNNKKFTCFISLKDEHMNLAVSIIKNNNKYKLLCLNDSGNIIDFAKCKKEIIDAFDTRFPEKSIFEV